MPLKQPGEELIGNRRGTLLGVQFMSTESVDLVSRKAEVPVTPHRFSVDGWAGMLLSTLLLRVVLLAVNFNDHPNAMRQQHQEVHALDQKPLLLSARVKLFHGSGIVVEIHLRQKRRKTST